jgi:hypothetical protein
MSDDRSSLAAAVARLEEVTRRLETGEEAEAALKELADEALAASATIAELVPRVIREIERAAEGGLAADNPET